jgi:hypothetical protein
MRVFLSAVSGQFKECRDALAGDLRAVGAEVVVQEDFQQLGGVVVSETAVVGEFLAAARVGNADMRCDQNVRRAWVANGRQARSVEQLRDSRSPENLADACDIAGCRRLRFQQTNRALRGAAAIQPEQRNVILGRALTYLTNQV